MTLRSEESELRTRFKVSMLGVIGGLLVLLVVVIAGCRDAEPETATGPTVPPSVATSIATPEPTSIVTPAPTNTPSPTPTDLLTATPTSTHSDIPTPTDLPTAVPTYTPTATVVPTVAAEPPSTATPASLSGPGAELSDLVSGNSAFAFDLYRALSAEDGNLFYSPYSISLALAMTYAGARGETESQMADTLHFDLPQNTLHPTFNALDLELASRGEGVQEGFRLNIANAVWGQKDYDFLQSFLDVLAESYGAGVKPIDFQAAPDRARITINDWVAEQTEDRIKDLIPQKVIDELTRMVLTNAIYFNANWRYPFYEGYTKELPFYLLDGSEVLVLMMQQDGRLGYAKGDGYQAVDLRYRGNELSMTILLPDEGRFREFEESMDAALVGRVLEDIGVAHVELTMPKFEFESQFDLKDTLKSMGMPDAFLPDHADFSGMSTLGGLYIGDVFHKAFVAVDEEGTEAAAATAVDVVESGPPPDPPVVTVDRPFIFLIRDKPTGSILFLGRVTDPSGGQ